MLLRKQQGILHFVTMNHFSFHKRTTLKMDMKQVPIFKFTTICKKRICAEMVTVPGWTKNIKKENLSGNMLKNTWDLALMQLYVVNSCCCPYV